MRNVAGMRLFHIIDPRVWAESVQAGEYRPPSLRTEGFVHFSFPEQVAGTANLLYRDEPDLVVVEIESDRVGVDVVVEDTVGGGGPEFPHLYAAIPTAAAVAIHPLHRDAQGDWVFSPGGATAAASPGR
jgi:uncharacterized protein (DUF952 family)